jgi:hypothetical protein
MSKANTKNKTSPVKSTVARAEIDDSMILVILPPPNSVDNLDGNKKQTTKKNVTQYFVNNYEEFINDGDFNSANEKVVASNMLGSSEFYKRSLNALLESKPEKASALFRDMMNYYNENKEQGGLRNLFSTVVTPNVFVEYFKLVTKKRAHHESANQNLFNFGFIHGLEFIMTVLEDDFVASKKIINSEPCLFNQIAGAMTTDLHDVVTVIGEFFLQDAISLELLKSRKVLMKVFNLFFQMEYSKQFVAFPSLFSQFVRGTVSGGLRGPENLNSFLEGIEADAKIKIINYVLVSRCIYKLSEKKDDKFNFSKLEDLNLLFNLLPKNKSTNKGLLELFFISVYHIVLAIVSNARSSYLQNEKPRELVDDISMEVENEVKIVQQLDTIFNILNTWHKETEAIFEDNNVYVLSTLKYIESVKRELQLK